MKGSPLDPTAHELDLGQPVAADSDRDDALVRHTGDVLRAGVPLTLLMDLAEPEGPDSAESFTSEGGDASWLNPA